MNRMSKPKILELTPENFRTFLTRRSPNNLNQFKTCSDEVRRQCAEILLDAVVESHHSSKYRKSDIDLIVKFIHMRKNFEGVSDEFAALANEILCRHSKKSDNGKTFMVHLTELIELEMKKLNLPCHRIFIIGDFLCCLYNLGSIKDSLVWKWIQHQMRAPDDIFVHWFDIWLNSIEDRIEENNPAKFQNWQEQLNSFIRKRKSFWTHNELIKNMSEKKESYNRFFKTSIINLCLEVHFLIRKGLNEGLDQSMPMTLESVIECLMELPWLSTEERSEEIRKCIIVNSHFYFYDRALSKDELFQRVKFILDLHRESVISDNVLRDIVGRIIESAKFNRDVAKAQLKAISQFWGEQKCKEIFGEENAKNIMELAEDAKFQDEPEAVEVTLANFKTFLYSIGPRNAISRVRTQFFESCSDTERRLCAEIFLDVIVDSEDGTHNFGSLAKEINGWFSTCSGNQKSLIVHLTDVIDLKKDNAYKPCFRTYRIANFLSELYALGCIKESTAWKWLEYQMTTPDAFFAGLFGSMLGTMQSRMRQINPLILEQWQKKLNSFLDLNPDWPGPFDFSIPHDFDDILKQMYCWRIGSHHQILEKILELKMPTRAHVRFVASSVIVKALESDIPRMEFFLLLIELPWSKNGEFQTDMKKSILRANSFIYKDPVCKEKIRKQIKFIADLHTRTALTDETLQDLFNVFIESALYDREFAKLQLKVIHEIFGEKQLKKLLGKNQAKVIIELVQKNFRQAGTSKAPTTVKSSQNIETRQPTQNVEPQTKETALSTQTYGDSKGSPGISESSMKLQSSPQTLIESLWENILENPERTKELAKSFDSTVKAKTTKVVQEYFIEFLQRRIDTFASISNDDYTEKIRKRLEGVMIFIAEIYVLDLITEEILRTFLKSIENLTLASLNKFISVIESRNVRGSPLIIELLEIEHKKSLEFWQDLKKDANEIHEVLFIEKEAGGKEIIDCNSCKQEGMR